MVVSTAERKKPSAEPIRLDEARTVITTVVYYNVTRDDTSHLVDVNVSIGKSNSVGETVDVSKSQSQFVIVQKTTLESTLQLTISSGVPMIIERKVVGTGRGTETEDDSIDDDVWAIALSIQKRISHEPSVFWGHVRGNNLADAFKMLGITLTEVS